MTAPAPNPGPSPPGPRPEDPVRTSEQRAALVVGSVFLGVGLLCAVETWYRIHGGRAALAIHILPVAYLALGWITLLFGLAQLSEHPRARSEARGPWLVSGLLVFLLSAPLAASFGYPVHTISSTFTCDCGVRGRAVGSQNYWRDWLHTEVQRLGFTPTPPQAGRPSHRTCKHSEHVPWSAPD